MEIFDNVTRIVRDDLTETIKPHSRISIAAACFSIYAYQELKKQLSSVSALSENLIYELFIFLPRGVGTEL